MLFFSEFNQSVVLKVIKQNGQRRGHESVEELDLPGKEASVRRAARDVATQAKNRYCGTDYGSCEPDLPNLLHEIAAQVLANLAASASRTI